MENNKAMALLPEDVYDHRATNEGWITNQQGLRLKTYRWAAAGDKAPQAVLVLVHGLASHPLFEWLRHPSCTNTRGTSKVDKYEILFEGSWIQAFTNEGFEVWAYDQQSHGLSDAWEGTRCNVKSFDNFVDDALQFLTYVNEQVITNGKTALPIFILGHSMGGNIVAQTVARGLVEERIVKREDPQTSTKPAIAGAVLLAAALDLSSVKEQPMNKILLPFVKPVAYMFPHAKLASKVSSTQFPYTQDLFEMDPLTVTKDKCPSRIASELMKASDNVHLVVPNISVPVGIWHSIGDTYCNVEGAEKVLSRLPENPHNQLTHLTKNWHYLMKEPNNVTLCEDIKQWMKSVLNGRPQVSSPLAAATVAVNLRGRRAKSFGLSSQVEEGPSIVTQQSLDQKIPPKNVSSLEKKHSSPPSLDASVEKTESFENKKGKSNFKANETKPAAREAALSKDNTSKAAAREAALSKDNTSNPAAREAALSKDNTSNPAAREAALSKDNTSKAAAREAALSKDNTSKAAAREAALSKDNTSKAAAVPHKEQ